MELIDVGLHFVIGGIGAITGYAVRTLCPHLWHKVVVGSILVLAEAVASVALVG